MGVIAPIIGAVVAGIGAITSVVQGIRGLHKAGKEEEQAKERQNQLYGVLSQMGGPADIAAGTDAMGPAKVGVPPVQGVGIPSQLEDEKKRREQRAQTLGSNYESPILNRFFG